MDLQVLIDAALAEDVGEGDVTTEATVPEGSRARATIRQKQAGVIYGVEAAIAVFTRLDPDAEVEAGPQGEWREPGAIVMAVTGAARALLTGERTALNFLQRLSGIATATAEVVRAVGPDGATVLDTRKTTPGLRELEKRAVKAGGGGNHRQGLFDAFLIKENHIAAAGGIAAAVSRARDHRPDLTVEVEVRDESELDQALQAGVDRLLLDNFTTEQIVRAVERTAGRAELEASGGITPETVVVYATIKGLHYVSLGWLTHSAPALDLSLLLEPLP